MQLGHNRGQRVAIAICFFGLLGVLCSAFYMIWATSDFLHIPAFGIRLLLSSLLILLSGAVIGGATV